MKDKKFKILSIDGGGMRGIIPARILCDLEEELIKKEGENARLCDYFDLICGTSTGSIIAVGIALGMTAKEILALYKEHAEDIFPNKSKLAKLYAIFRNKPFYERKALATYLNNEYNRVTRNKDTRVYYCKTRICIPAYDVDKGEVHVFKTDHLDKYYKDCHIPAVDVVLSSSAAPVYFYPYSFKYASLGINDTNWYKNNIDGGMFANNPTLIGFIEATCCMNIAPEHISILSLGTGTTNFKVHKKEKYLGSRFWINPISGSLKVYEAMASAQSVFIDNLMKVICKGPGQEDLKRVRYVRIQKELDECIDLDASDEDSIQKLENIGQELYKKYGEIMKPFVSEKIKQYKHHIN